VESTQLNTSKPAIVSLSPDVTEMLHFIGLGNYQKGRSHECDYPEQVKTLPFCSKLLFPNNLSSIEIDREIKRRINNKEEIYAIKWEEIESLNPTHIFTQGVCYVCGPTCKNLNGRLDHLEKKEFNITNLNELFLNLEELASVFNCSVSPIVDKLKIDFASIKKCSTYKSVLFVEWLDPIIVGGHWLPELIEIAGGTPSIKSKTSVVVGDDDLEKLPAPDLIVFAPCGFDIVRTEKELEEIKTISKKVKAKRAVVCDGNALFNRPGPRLLESAQVLSEILTGTEYGVKNFWKELDVYSN